MLGSEIAHRMPLEHPMGIAGDLILIVLVALIGALIARIFRQPLILGYILAGVMVGPNTGGVTVRAIHDIEMLAEIGVALLLFTLGLEFSLKDMKRVARVVLIGTPAQLVLSALAGFMLAREFGLPAREAIWFGCAISLSSTMVVLKSLGSDLDSKAGRIMIGILIAQDLALIPMMLVLPELARPQPNFSVIGSALLQALGFMIALYYAGTRLFPTVFGFIARWGSREMLFLAFLAVALGVGFLSYVIGLSFAFGAFLAGMVLSQSEFSHQALSDVAALRDLFGMLFFVSVGMLFDPMFFYNNIVAIITVLMVLVVSKALVTGVIVRALGYRGSAPWAVGLGLSQIGEFAFLIANTGQRQYFITSDTFSLLISVAVVSMILTPALLAIAPLLYEMKKRLIPDRQTAPKLELPEISADNHVVIIGGGTVGEFVATVLSGLSVPFVLIEMDHVCARRLGDRFQNVIFGDASQHVILSAAGVEAAKLAIISVTNLHFAPSIVKEIRSINPKLPLVARVDEVEELSALNSLGIQEVVQPQLEAGLEMIRQSLLALGRKEADILGILGHLRLKNYHVNDLGQSGARARKLTDLSPSQLLEFGWYEVQSNPALVGFSLEELRLRDEYGISIVGVVRGEEFIPVPGGSLKIEEKDVLGAVGTRFQLASFHSLLEGHAQR